MSRNGGKKRRKKMPLSRFSNWRFNKSLLLDNRKNPLNKSAQTPLRSVLCKLLISVLLDTNWKALIATVAKELILAADLRTLHA